MADVSTMAAAPREGNGKGFARAARRQGFVPGIIYGNNLEPVMLNVERKRLEQELHKPGFFIQLMDIAVGDENHRVLPRDVQFHPVTDVPIHVDFLRFDPNRRLTVAIPVIFEKEEESPGIKRGGVLNVVRHEIECLCTADNIPQPFRLALTDLEIGDAVHASAITLPEGVTFQISDRDFTIATIAAPTVVAEEAAAEAEGEEGEEGVEGEVPAEGEAPAEGAAEAPAEGGGEEEKQE